MLLHHLMMILTVMALSSLPVFTPVSTAEADGQDEIIKAEASYEFGNFLRFTLVVKSNQEVKGGNVKF